MASRYFYRKNINGNVRTTISADVDMQRKIKVQLSLQPMRNLETYFNLEAQSKMTLPIFYTMRFVVYETDFRLVLGLWT